MRCWSSGQGWGEAEPLLSVNIVQAFEDYYLEGTLYYWPVLCVAISQCGPMQYISGNIKTLLLLHRELNSF